MKKLIIMACFGMLLWAGTAGAITWEIDSQMLVNLEVSILEGGLYQYKIDFTFNDPANTENPHSDMCLFILWPNVSNAFITQLRGAFAKIYELNDHGVALPEDGDHDPSPNFFFGNIWFKNYFEGCGMAWGTQAGLTFTSTDYYLGPMDFAYDTYDWYGANRPADHDYAAGVTSDPFSPVPLPPAALLFGSGLVGLLAAGYRKLSVRH